MAEKKSIFSRPLDLIYFVYFATHIPVTLGIDFQLFYPSHWVPTALSDALDFYINTFKDPFMGSPTTLYWFASFICCELVVQLPFFFIACVGLLKGKKKEKKKKLVRQFLQINSNRLQVHPSSSCQ